MAVSYAQTGMFWHLVAGVSINRACAWNGTQAALSITPAAKQLCRTCV
jgi:hypothetical protein